MCDIDTWHHKAAYLLVPMLSWLSLSSSTLFKQQFNICDTRVSNRLLLAPPGKDASSLITQLSIYLSRKKKKKEHDRKKKKRRKITSIHVFLTPFPRLLLCNHVTHNIDILFLLHFKYFFLNLVLFDICSMRDSTYHDPSVFSSKIWKSSREVSWWHKRL